MTRIMDVSQFGEKESVQQHPQNMEAVLPYKYVEHRARHPSGRGWHVQQMDIKSRTQS